MSAPKFKIGEEVIRQAPKENCPELNGVYIVEDIISLSEMRKLHPTMICTGKYYYKLPSFYSKLNDGSVCRHGSETFLRKKYPPATESFHEMMAKLKSKEKA